MIDGRRGARGTAFVFVLLRRGGFMVGNTLQLTLERLKVGRRDVRFLGRNMKLLDIRGMKLLDLRGMKLLDIRGMKLLDLRGMKLLDLRGMKLFDIRGMKLLDLRGMSSSTFGA